MKIKNSLLVSGFILLAILPACAFPPSPPSQVQHGLGVNSSSVLTGSDTNFFRNNSNLLNQSVAAATGGVVLDTNNAAWTGFTNFCVTNYLSVAQAKSGTFPFNLQSATGYPWSALVGVPNVATTNDSRALHLLNGGNTFAGSFTGELTGSGGNFNLRNSSFWINDSGVGANIFDWQRDDHFMIGARLSGTPYLSFWGNSPVPNGTIFGFSLDMNNGENVINFGSFLIHQTGAGLVIESPDNGSWMQMDIDGNIITSGSFSATGLQIASHAGIFVTKTNYTRNAANTATVTNVITITGGIITGWTP